MKMEKRNISVDLTTAKEWYNGNNKALKELALQAFKEEELKTIPWECIKTFEDAIEAVGECPIKISMMLTGLPKQAQAIIMLDIIKKALNGDWNPQLNEGRIYYSWLRWYPQGDKYPKEWEKVGMFRDLINHKNYTLVGGGYCNDYDGGLGYFHCGFGAPYALQGLLGCKSKGIAIHLVKYFGKVVFDAIYAQYNNYIWL